MKTLIRTDTENRGRTTVEHWDIEGSTYWASFGNQSDDVPPVRDSDGCPIMRHRGGGAVACGGFI